MHGKCVADWGRSRMKWGSGVCGRLARNQLQIKTADSVWAVIVLRFFLVRFYPLEANGNVKTTLQHGDTTFIF